MSLLKDNHPMIRLKRTDKFITWYKGLKDSQGKAHIVTRLKRVTQGNIGDVRPVGEGVSEMRIHFGPGYRIYFAREDDIVHVLLLGGDKKNQQRDITQAKALWAALKRSTLK